MRCSLLLVAALLLAPVAWSCNVEMTRGDAERLVARAAKSAERWNVNDMACLGDAYFFLGDHQRSAEVYEVLLRRTLTDDERMMAYHGHAVALKYLGRSRQAIALLEKKLALAQRSGDEELIAITYATMASIYGDDNDPAGLRKSIALSKKSLPGLRTSSDRSATHNNIAMAYRALGDAASALDHIEQSIRIDRSTGDDWQLAIHLINKGGLQNFRGRFDEALVTLEEGLRVAREQGNLFWIVQGELELEEAYTGLKDLPSARRARARMQAVCARLPGCAES